MSTVITKNNELAIAAHYEELAKLHRANANVKKMTLAEVLAAKKAKSDKDNHRLDKYASAAAQFSNENHLKSAHELLSKGGYTKESADPKTGKAIYFKTKNPAEKVKIEVPHFSVVNGSNVKQEKTHLKNLPEYLNRPKTVDESLVEKSQLRKQ